LEIVTSTHDKEAAEERAAALQKQLDQIDAQQEHWDEMHRASEQISHLLSLVEQGDNEEIKELRINRDRTKLLEGEFAALQRRFKDQENKAASHERAMAGVRQNLAQAQQRAAEWEKRAKDQEAEIESTRSRLDEADQAHSQLDAELSLVKLQLQEKETDERTAKASFRFG
jgi:chromosome segregation ATPase